jgi:hypothetical protein
LLLLLQASGLSYSLKTGAVNIHLDFSAEIKYKIYHDKFTTYVSN